MKTKLYFGYSHWLHMKSKQWSADSVVDIPVIKLNKQTKRLGKIFFSGVLATTLAVVGYAEVEPGFRRQLRFWQVLGPLACEYFITDKMYPESPNLFSRVRNMVSYGLIWSHHQVEPDDHQERKKMEEIRDAQFTVLHLKYAPILLSLVLELRGVFIKFAQVLSVRPEAVPLEYRNAFKTVQNDVPVDSDPAVIISTIERELCRESHKTISELFSSFNLEPCGAASIGQTHIATTVDGERVAVKIQYPDAKWKFEADIRCIGQFCNLFYSKVIPLFSEFSRQILTELDYENEARNLIDVYESVMPRYSHVVAIPRVLQDLCSPKVITMTYLEGELMSERCKVLLENAGVQGGVKGFIYSSINQGSEARNESARNNHSSAMTWSARIKAVLISWIGVDRLFWLHATGRAIWWSLQRGFVRSLLWLRVDCIFPTAWSTALSNMGKRAEQARALKFVRGWLDVLLDVHGFEVFHSKVFNGDPHPGNVIIMPDNRLGLIDYGQCKRLPIEEKKKFAALMIAIADPESTEEEIANAFRAAGFSSKRDDPAFLACIAQLCFGRLKSEQMNNRRYYQELNSTDELRFPSEAVMIYRTAMLLRGLSLVLGFNISVAEAWKPHAEALLNKQRN